MNKCASCKSFYEPTQKPNGKYYKSCYKCLLKSKNKNKENTEDEPIKTEEPINTEEEPIKTDNNIIDEYKNIINIKNDIIEKLNKDIKNLNHIVNDYKKTLSQQQQQQPQQPQQPQQNKTDNRLEEMIKSLMKY